MLEKLKQLGWTEYEARVYVSLLQQSPTTGYRAARASGVPGAKIYEVLARLVERGAIRANQDGSNEVTQYTPVPPDEVLAGMRARQSRMLDELARELTALISGPLDTPDTRWLSGRAPVLGRAEALLSGAARSIALVTPTGWENVLRGGVESARARRVRVEQVGLEICSPMPGADTSRLFVLVVDGAEALIGALGETTSDRSAVALATRVPFLVQLCSDYVRLRRAVALVPDVVIRLQRHDDWLDWEDLKQRRLLQDIAARSGRASAN